MKSVDLSGTSIPVAIIELVPEAVARENVLIPIAEKNGIIQIAMRDPSDYETVLKVQFILAKDIEPILASAQQIVVAIDRHYRQP